ncbi:TetR/AcrR family transcriptional regulator [Alphaproteobacteria bacterium]|nr:TetR/AcrR family transcriptional regulator [Alphaproteobacteria bacterium]
MSVVARKLPEPDEAPTKRELVVDFACRLFLKDGYGLNSMDLVATYTKVSKRTVYSYFQNKELPFIDIMEDMCYLFGEGALDTIKFDGPPDKFLRESARVPLLKEPAPNSQPPGPDTGNHHPRRQFAGDGAKTLG